MIDVVQANMLPETSILTAFLNNMAQKRFLMVSCDGTFAPLLGQLGHLY